MKVPARPARPKSVMRTRPSASSMMLAGLRSRCSTPQSCAAARPAQIWRAISVARSREAADALQQPGQIFAVDQLHRQEHAAVVLADVVDAADVAVRHLARDAHLVVELGEPLRISATAGSRNFSATFCPRRRSSAR